MFSDVRGAVVRCWYVLLVGLSTTAGVCFGVSQVIPLTYEARALTVLLPPKALLATGGNPYLGLGGLDSAASVLSKSMYSQDMAQRVIDASPTAEYTVEPDASTSGPVLITVVQDRSPEGSLKALGTLLDALPAQLEKLQVDSNAPQRYLITMTVVTKDDEPTTLYKSQVRAIIAVCGAGIAGSVMLVALLDGMLQRRRARRADAVERDAPEPDAPEPHRPEPRGAAPDRPSRPPTVPDPTAQDLGAPDHRSRPAADADDADDADTLPDDEPGRPAPWHTSSMRS